MNIHICNDDIFINKARELFEQYYPGENVFYIISSNLLKPGLRKVEEAEKVIPIAIGRKKSIKEIQRNISDGDRLFIHFLSTFNAPIAVRLKKQKDIRTYWIFYGSDLYNMLDDKGIYRLLDEDFGWMKKKAGSFFRWIKDLLLSAFFQTNIRTVRERFIAELDYFCFWNHHDYRLLKAHYTTNARFKYFRYFTHNLDAANPIVKKEPGTIVLNHSADDSGNHLSMMKLLRQIDKDRSIKKLIVPLSYGSTEVRNRVKLYGETHLDYCFNPLYEMLPPDEYFRLLRSAGTAIFGHRRQSGAGNIFNLLEGGAKVFLRQDNNFLNYLEERGIKVFIVEKDLKSIEDLAPLDPETQEANRLCLMAEIGPSEIDRVFQHLI